jgi:DNA-binding response OmpR family regulator
MLSLPAVNGASPRILAITDDPSILALFQDLRKVEGYHVSIHVSVDHDLPEITTLQPNVIILDCVGALEDASWTLLLVLRSDSATVAIPLILCTGSVRDVELLPPHLTVMGISVVIKPFTLEQLCEAIQERLIAA